VKSAFNDKGLPAYSSFIFDKRCARQRNLALVLYWQELEYSKQAEGLINIQQANM